MREMDFSQAVDWSEEVGDPRVVRPTPEQWDMAEAAVRISWNDMPSLGDRPRLLLPEVQPPNSEELQYAPFIFEVFVDVDADAYNQKDPPGSQLREIPGQDHGDFLDWEITE